MNPDNYTREYGTERLHAFSEVYAEYHGYVSVCVCALGIICNLLNILVLTRKNMISSTNTILTGLAVADMATMMSYIPFAVRFYLLKHQGPQYLYSYAWQMFLMFHANFSNITHTCSIWLGVLLSVFRYIFVRCAADRGNMLSLSRTKFAVAMVYVGAIIILIPNALSIHVFAFEDPSTNMTLYQLDYVNKSTEFGRVILKVNFWLHAILIKLVPCGMLSVFGALLICTMHVTYKRRQRLRNQGSGKPSRQRMREHARTTRMLVVVIVLFLVTELPQGILALLSGVKGEGFHKAVYLPLGDLMDIAALINNSINFALYCSMSKQFRDTFLTLICGKSRRKYFRKSQGTEDSCMQSRNLIATETVNLTNGANGSSRLNNVRKEYKEPMLTPAVPAREDDSGKEDS